MVTKLKFKQDDAGRRWANARTQKANVHITDHDDGRVVVDVMFNNGRQIQREFGKTEDAQNFVTDLRGL